MAKSMRDAVVVGPTGVYWIFGGLLAGAKH